MAAPRTGGATSVGLASSGAVGSAASCPHNSHAMAGLSTVKPMKRNSLLPSRRRRLDAAHAPMNSLACGEAGSLPMLMKAIKSAATLWESKPRTRNSGGIWLERITELT
jgi:hypothetical protein